MEIEENTDVDVEARPVSYGLLDSKYQRLSLVESGVSFLSYITLGMSRSFSRPCFQPHGISGGF